MIHVRLFAFVLAPAEADRATLLTIDGIPYCVVRRVEARSDCEAKWIPILEVEKRTALRSKPTKESVAEQPE